MNAVAIRDPKIQRFVDSEFRRLVLISLLTPVVYDTPCMI